MPKSLSRSALRNALLDDVDKLLDTNDRAQQVAHLAQRLVSCLLAKRGAEVRAPANDTRVEDQVEKLIDGLCRRIEDRGTHEAPHTHNRTKAQPSPARTHLPREFDAEAASVLWRHRSQCASEVEPTLALRPRR